MLLFPTTVLTRLFDRGQSSTSDETTHNTALVVDLHRFKQLRDVIYPVLRLEGMFHSRPLVEGVKVYFFHSHTHTYIFIYIVGAISQNDSLDVCFWEGGFY